MVNGEEKGGIAMFDCDPQQPSLPSLPYFLMTGITLYKIPITPLMMTYPTLGLFSYLQICQM